MTGAELARRLLAPLPRQLHPAPPPGALEAPVIVVAQAGEPLSGKELHVMYHVIVPTEAFANVRFIASQTAAYNNGEGATLEQRQAALAREARGLRVQMMEESERLRRDLSQKAFVRPVSQRSRTKESSTT